MNCITRRNFLQVAGCAALGAIGCRSSSSEKHSAREELRVFVYAGGHEATMREVFVPRFEKLSGAKVTLFPGWWDGMVKLKTAPAENPPFDLMITDATQGYPAAREGLLAPIDFANVPTHSELAPASLDNWIFRERHGLPYPDSVMTCAFNRKLILETPRGWADLLRPNLAGQLGLYNHMYMSLFTFAAMLADSNGRAGTAQELIRTEMDEVFRFARDNRKQVKLWWPTTTEMILALHDQSVAAGNMHSPEYLQALREKPELGAMVPERDRPMVQVFWGHSSGNEIKKPCRASARFLVFGRNSAPVRSPWNGNVTARYGRKNGQ